MAKMTPIASLLSESLTHSVKAACRAPWQPVGTLRWHEQLLVGRVNVWRLSR